MTSQSFSTRPEPEVCDVTNDWVDTDIHEMETQENASSYKKYIHPESDPHHGLSIRGKAKLKEMYPECFSGVSKFKDFEYNINIEKKPSNMWCIHHSGLPYH